MTECHICGEELRDGDVVIKDPPTDILLCGKDCAREYIKRHQAEFNEVLIQREFTEYRVGI